jgi:hypothetical protein
MRDGIHTGAIVRIGAGALAVLVLVVGAAMALARRWDDGPGTRPVATPRGWIAGPVLETAPQTDLAQYLAQKQQVIEGYAWIDQRAGVARIPVDVAMRALADQAAQKSHGEGKP